MNHSTPNGQHPINATTSDVRQPRARQAGANGAVKHRKTAKRENLFKLCLALVCVGLLLSIYPLAVEGNKINLQGKIGGAEVQGTSVEVISSARVNFQDLARQQALNPKGSDAIPKPVHQPLSIIEVDGEQGTPPPNAPVDVPGPLIPSPSPAANFAALDDIPFAPPGTPFFTIPPDTTGAVGRDSVNKVFVTLNNNYRVQDKTTGAQIGGDVSMTNFWAPVGAVSPFDPRVQYDRYNDRWIVAGVSDSLSATTAILVGISATNDPSGAYTLFKVAARIGGDAANLNFADFPMLGFNRNWVVVSINMFTSAGAFSNGRSLVIDYPTFRTGVLAATYFTGVTAAAAGFCMHPATTYSATENIEYLVAHLSSGGATYRMHTITGTPAAPVFTLGVTKTRPGGGWTQPGGNILPQAQGTCATTPLRIDVGDAFTRHNVVFRNGTIWYAQTIGLPAGVLTHTAAQWTQLNASGDVIQGGRVDDPTATNINGGKWYAYPSIAVNSADDVLLGFSQFSSAQFASAGYTYKDHTDAAGTMRDPLIFKAGEDCYSKDFGSGRNRWGDFSHTMVDPSGDCSLWSIQEYAKLQAPPTVGGSTSKWGTWWTRVDALACVCSESFTNPAAITIPASGVATPYPSNITVAGLGNISATSGSVQVTINGFSHTFPDDVGFVLVGPTGAALLIQDAAGDAADMVNVTYTLSDTGATQLPNLTAWAAGTYRPTAFFNDNFPAPGPGLGYGNPGPVGGGTATFASVFGGTNPNGVWKLFVADFVGGDSGSLAGGWSLALNAACPGGCTSITCPANVTQTNDPNQCGAVVTYPAPTPNGTCGTITCSPASGSFFPVGTTTVTCTSSAGPTCTFTVTVTDDQPPTITCPANITVSNDLNQCGAVVNYPPPTVTDNCPGSFTATCSPASGSFFPVGTTTVTCTASGNRAISSTGDASPVGGSREPTAKAESPSGGEVNNGDTGKVPKKEAGGGSAGSGPAPPEAPFAVLYDQTGVSNNGSPSQNFEAGNDPFDCQAADDFVVPAGETWNVTQVNVGGTFSVGGGPPTSINVTFFDNSGSLPGATAVATFNNVVTFSSSPNFNITLPAVAVLAPGTYWVSVQVNMNFTPTGQWFWSNFGVSNIGSEYAWRNPGGGFATSCTNFGPGSTGCLVGGGVNRNNIFTIIGTIDEPPTGGPTCTFTVTVNDTQAPTVTCPPNVTAVTALTCPASSSTVVDFPPPTASDNCPGVTVACVPPSGSIFPVGTTTVTCTATDASGNTATCTFTVSVFDVCLQDDSNPSTKLLINSFTGEYRFLCQGTLYPGVGKVSGLGCDKQLVHNPAGRRVRANWTVPAKKGNASIQSPPGTVRCTLGDSDMTNNDCATGLAEENGDKKPGKK